MGGAAEDRSCSSEPKFVTTKKRAQRALRLGFEKKPPEIQSVPIAGQKKRRLYSN